MWPRCTFLKRFLYYIMQGSSELLVFDWWYTKWYGLKTAVKIAFLYSASYMILPEERFMVRWKSYDLCLSNPFKVINFLHLQVWPKLSHINFFWVDQEFWIERDSVPSSALPHWAHSNSRHIRRWDNPRNNICPLRNCSRLGHRRYSNSPLSHQQSKHTGLLHIPPHKRRSKVKEERWI